MINNTKLICFYGPESTGKSVMARKMAEHYQTLSVPEVAREIILSSDFTTEDITRIGYAQTQRVVDYAKTANRFLFCDTDLITTQIYCHHYLHQVPPILMELEKQIVYDHYFLFDIDVPWVADGMRDLGNQRQTMFNVFKAELESRQISYHLIKGGWIEREEKIKAVLNLL